jgi:aerobic carbon-monoxide dehydrogenase medium subunit
MKAAPFDYMVPTTVADASAALGLDAMSAIAIAGGQSLVPMLNLRIALPDVVVSLAGLQELKETRLTPTGLRIGALTTHAEIEDGRIPDLFGGLMRTVAAGISYRAIRNYGTVGGSTALADPAADWPVCLMALGAEVRISGRAGARTQAIGDFIRGHYATSLARDEIILGFDIPSPDARLRWGLFKVARKSGAFASSIAVAVQRGHGGPVSVALGAAAPRPCLLATVAACMASGTSSEDKLRSAIADDLALHVADADGYLVRLHTSTVLHALREMWRQ